MAAAYAALVSLTHIIEQIQHHPRPPISLDQTQVEFLTEKVTFLKEFLEDHSHGGNIRANDLESRIADVAYAAEDIIESHIVDRIHAESTPTEAEEVSSGEESSSSDLYQSLQKVIEDMDYIKRAAMEIEDNTGVQHPLQKNSSIPAGSLRSSTELDNTMVGFDDVLYQMMDKLIGWQPDLQIIPIVGMGGIGKTTLARNIYQKKVVQNHFDIRAWVTISQEYRMQEIVLQLLQESSENFSQMNEYELGDKLHKSLLGRRYLIIMDDIWNIEVWEQLKFFFPDNNNGSRIILTTRLSKLAFQVAGSHGIEIGFLDEDNSWNLFRKNVFREEDCPLEIKEIGKKIVEKCKGLPLSIIVIGGLLARSKKTPYWEFVLENLNSIVNLEDNERCLQILYMSYKSLPVHLKPCFLYMGIYPEDSHIRASQLIKLWVAEGFLKLVHGKSLEEVVEDYLEELIDRNLILVEECNFYGKIKFCNIHDLLRDLCLRESRKQKFFCVLREKSQNINSERRICIHQRRLDSPQALHALKSTPLIRSLIWQFQESSPSFTLKLLRVSSLVDKYFYEDEIGDEYSLEFVFRQVNLRYLAFKEDVSGFLPSSISLLWNLQTLIFVGDSGLIMAPIEIWKMTQLRHIQIEGLCLPDPPSDYTDEIVLENLQTLSFVYDLKCDEELVKRIPNIKKLKISYALFEEGSPVYHLNNIGRLEKLESLRCSFEPKYMPIHFVPHVVSYVVRNLTFPHSLKKLTLDGIHIHWEDLTTTIGSLPLLQVLKLYKVSSEEPLWDTVEGQFCSLKFLLIEYCDLEYWMTDSSHFPCLQHLVLGNLPLLQEIPLCIGDIPTLQSIQLRFCTDAAVDSAKKILEEQEELGNVGLQVQLQPSGCQNLPYIRKLQRIPNY